MSRLDSSHSEAGTSACDDVTTRSLAASPWRLVDAPAVVIADGVCGRAIASGRQLTDCLVVAAAAAAAAVGP